MSLHNQKHIMSFRHAIDPRDNHRSLASAYRMNYSFDKYIPMKCSSVSVPLVRELNLRFLTFQTRYRP